MRGRYLAVCSTCGRELRRGRPLGAREVLVCVCTTCAGVDPLTAKERATVARFLEGKGGDE